MKLSIFSFLALLALNAVAEEASLRGIDQLSTDDDVEAEARIGKKYEADLGPYGKFFFRIKLRGRSPVWQRTMTYISELENLNNITSTKDLNYHLHTDWVNTEDYSTTSCGPDVSGDHYDPYLGCGGASAQSNEACDLIGRPKSEYGDKGRCVNYEKAYYNTEGILKCEVGDLSGKYGSINVKNDGTAKKEIYNDPISARTRDYKKNGSKVQNNPKRFASIVFSDGSRRVLCGKLVEIIEE